MVGDILQPTHLLLVLLVALVVLGPKRLPEVARKLGDGMRDFKAAISFDSDKGEEDRPRHEITGGYSSEPKPKPEPALEPKPEPPSPSPRAESPS